MYARVGWYCVGVKSSTYCNDHNLLRNYISISDSVLRNLSINAISMSNAKNAVPLGYVPHYS